VKNELAEKNEKREKAMLQFGSEKRTDTTKLNRNKSTKMNKNNSTEQWYRKNVF